MLREGKVGGVDVIMGIATVVSGAERENFVFCHLLTRLIRVLILNTLSRPGVGTMGLATLFFLVFLGGGGV